MTQKGWQQAVRLDGAHAHQGVVIGPGAFLILDMIENVGKRGFDVGQLHIVAHRAPLGSVHVLGRVTEARAEVGLDDGVFIQADCRIISSFDDAAAVVFECRAQIFPVEIPGDLGAAAPRVGFQFFLLRRRVVLFKEREALLKNQ